MTLFGRIVFKFLLLLRSGIACPGRGLRVLCEKISLRKPQREVQKTLRMYILARFHPRAFFYSRMMFPLAVNFFLSKPLAASFFDVSRRATRQLPSASGHVIRPRSRKFQNLVVTSDKYNVERQSSTIPTIEISMIEIIFCRTSIYYLQYINFKMF